MSVVVYIYDGAAFNSLIADCHVHLNTRGTFTVGKSNYLLEGRRAGEKHRRNWAGICPSPAGRRICLVQACLAQSYIHVLIMEDIFLNDVGNVSTAVTVIAIITVILIWWDLLSCAAGRVFCLSVCHLICLNLILTTSYSAYDAPKILRRGTYCRA